VNEPGVGLQPSEKRSCRVERLPWTAWETVAPRWRELEELVALPTPFLSETWVRTWLEVYGPRLQPDVLVFHGDSGIVGCCLLTRREAPWSEARLRRLHVNTAGEDEADEVCVEYNELPYVPGWETAIAGAFRRYLCGQRWDELHLEGWQPSPMRDALACVFEDLSQSWDRRASPFVALEQLRREALTYDASLSANTRQQLRRSRRLYEQQGPLRIVLPGTVDEALAALERLAALHQTHWRSRGEPGAFASELFLRFHRVLVARLFPNGVQLVEVLAGQKAVGLIYSLTHGQRAFFYQSGLSYDADNRLKPGLVTLAAAVEQALSRGFEEFDLLAGESRYKWSLASQSRELAWIRIEQLNPRMRLARTLHSALRRIRWYRTRTLVGSPPPTT
jgi:CelD/BcsL family acetyltransferase involved in cellulose biosynthesis